MNAPPVRVWWSSICPQVLISGYFSCILLVQTVIVRASGKQNQETCLLFYLFFQASLNPLRLWGRAGSY